MDKTSQEQLLGNSEQLPANLGTMQIIQEYKGEVTYYDHEPLGVFFTIKRFEDFIKTLNHSEHNLNMVSQYKEPVACPYPCGWQNLYSIIIEEGSYLVQHFDLETPPDERYWRKLSSIVSTAKDLCLFAMKLNTHPAQPFSEWISVKDRLPDYIEGKDYSENVLAMYSVGENTSYMGIFNIVIVEYTEDGHQYAWGKLDSCYGDIRISEPEWDDDYEVTHWMPLPDAPQAHGIGEKE